MNPVDLLVEIIAENTPETIWTGSPPEPYRLLGNTNRGEIGEEFIRRYLEGFGVGVVKGGRTARTGSLKATSLKSRRPLSAQTIPFNSTMCVSTETICISYVWAFARMKSCSICGARDRLRRAMPGLRCAWPKVKQSPRKSRRGSMRWCRLASFRCASVGFLLELAALGFDTLKPPNHRSRIRAVPSLRG